MHSRDNITSSRNPNVEVFRCLSMFLIVLTHAHCHGLWQSSCALWTFFFALLTWHVDGFLSISGWFGIKFAWSKVVRMYGIVCFYSLLSIAYGIVFHPAGYGLKDIKISGGWYGNTYLFLMFLAPFINCGVESLAQKGKKVLFSAWVGLALVFSLQWTPFGVKFGVCHSGESVYSLFTFVFVYLTARTMRLIDFDSKKLLAYGLGAYAVGFCIFMVASMKGCGLIVRLHNYRAPYVWLMACAMLVLFVREIKFPYWLERLCSLGPCMFGVYLLHDTTSFGGLIYLEPQRWLDAIGVHPFVAICISAVVCFSFCTMCDMVRRMVAKKLLLLWQI